MKIKILESEGYDDLEIQVTEFVKKTIPNEHFEIDISQTVNHLGRYSYLAVIKYYNWYL